MLVVSGLGSPSYDVYAAGDHEGNYYLWGAMGAASLVGLGLAQAQVDRTVVVVTGDGEQLMGLGGLATVAIAAPPNLVIVVLDNGHYGETGMQRSHTGFGLDIASVARAVGFADVRTIVDQAQVEEMAFSIREAASGPRFYAVKIRADILPRSLPPRDAVYGKNRLRMHLGFEVT
ncbi:MAG: thiamine pyrophosphate-dependent enzyme [Acidimicrobiales bacterium]